MGDCCLCRDLWGLCIIGLNLQFEIAERCRNKWMLGLRASFPGTSHCLKGTQSSKGNMANLDEAFTVILTGGWFNPWHIWRILSEQMVWIEQQTFPLFWTWALHVELQTWEATWQCRQDVPEAPQCQLSPWDWGGSGQLFAEEQLQRV